MKSVAVAVLALTSCHPPQSPRPAPAPQRGSADLSPPPPPAPQVEAILGQLTEGAHVRGFTATAIYLDDATPMGARFVA